MKAVGYKMPLPIENPDSLLDITLPEPEAKGRDLAVKIKAVSVNPVDVKVRASSKPEGSEYKVLGYDAAGIVTQAGPETVLFKPGDEVFHAGSIIHVDECMVRRPTAREKRGREDKSAQMYSAFGGA
jgi:NADPH2:quinone reductase